MPINDTSHLPVGSRWLESSALSITPYRLPSCQGRGADPSRMDLMGGAWEAWKEECVQSRELTSEADHRNEERGTEEKQRRPVPGRAVPGPHGMEAGGHVQPDEAGRDHERVPILAIDRHSPVWMVGHLQDQGRGHLAFDPQVNPARDNPLFVNSPAAWTSRSSRHY